jgi:hypothetical protein
MHVALFHDFRGTLFPFCGKSSDAIVSIALHPTNSNMYMWPRTSPSTKTRDGGDTWETDGDRPEHLPCALDRHRSRALCDRLAGTMFDAAYKSPDGGHHWMPYNAGPEGVRISRQPIHLPHMTAK